MSTVRTLADRGIARPPKFVPDNTHYETIMGSIAYGVSADSSDLDVYGFCIPPKEEIFPHLRGEVIGFGTLKSRFNVYQQHHLHDPTALNGAGRVYDLSIYNLVDYLHLVMKNNPNMIDSLFTPAECVLHCTKIGQMVRDARRSFLHKGSWHTFKGYAYSQMHKMTSKDPIGKRRELVDKFGFDVKFAYHTVRLLDEAEQILTEGDIDLRRNREQLKAIRRGDWTEQDIRDHFARKEKELETLYTNSSLPYAPDEETVKQLLLHCLEEHYGSLDKCIVNPNGADIALREIEAIIDRYRRTEANR